jgi:hypothetical protein
VRLKKNTIKKPTILNMIGFSFIFDARLLITEIINNESYVISDRHKIQDKTPCCDYYNGSRFKINPSFVFNPQVVNFRPFCGWKVQ